MMRLRQVIGIIGVVLMLISSMGAAVDAQEEGVAVPTETPAGADVAAGADGEGDTPNDSNTKDGGAGDSQPAAEPLPQTDSVEEEPSASDGNGDAVGQPGNDPVAPSEPTVEDRPAEPVTEDPPADADYEADPASDGATGSDTLGEPLQPGDPPAETRAQQSDTSMDTQALEVGEPDANATVEISNLVLSCDGMMTFTTVVNVSYERFEGHLILDIYEGDPAAGGEVMTTIAPSQGDALLAGTTAYTEDLGWSTSILANPYANVRWVLTAWSGPTRMDYVGEWRGSESAAMSGDCGAPGDGETTDPGDGEPTDPGDGVPTDPGDGDPTQPGAGLTSIDAGCDGVLSLEVDRAMEILAVATANGSGVGESWRFSAIPGQYTHDFWADGDPAATADDVVFTVYELNEYDEPLNTFYTTLSCSGKPFYDVEQFDLTCAGVLTVAYGERQPEFPLYNLYDGETGDQLGSSRSFYGTDFAIEPGVYDSLYVVGEDNWPTLPVYFIAEASVTGCLGGDPAPDPTETGQIALSLTLEDAAGNPDTSADGATADWTVEPLDSVAGNPSINGIRAAQTTPSTYSAVVSGGSASATTDPLPLGSYRVCLSNILTGGPNGDVSIADSPICDTVELTEAGATTPAAAAFTATIQDRDPTDPGDGTMLKVVSVAISSPNLCMFTGGTATVTGTTQVEGYDPSMRADLAVGWETPSGPVTWGTAHQGPGGTWADRALEVNGPWSISKQAWDPVIGGKDVGPERPANATAVFVTLELRQSLTEEPDAALTVRYSLADCGSDTDPDPVETGQIVLSMTLVDGSGNADTAADGSTATWTIEPVGTVSSNPNINGLRAAQSTTSTYNAVVAGGVASATTDPLPLGTYRVCLSHVLVGGSNGDVSIGDAPICAIIELSVAGTTTPAVAAFTATIQDGTVGSGAGDSPDPDSVDNTPGSSDAQDRHNGETAASATGGGSGRTTASGASPSRAASSASAPPDTGQTATTLPDTGAGPSGGSVASMLWLLFASFVAGSAGFAIRRRATT